MIRIYVDWGVMSQLKNGQHPGLLPLLKRKSQVQVVYSTSHISDILVSENGLDKQKERIKSDLDFISELTDDMCIYLAQNDVTIAYFAPHELFADRVDERELYGDDGPLAGGLRTHHPSLPGHGVVQSYLESPLPESISGAFSDPQSAVRMEQYYPGLAADPSMGNLMKTTWSNYRNLQETEAYKTMRITLQQGLGINRDKMFAQENPFEEIDRIHGEIMENTGFDIYGIMRNNNSPGWFQDISHNYIMLDMHGYQEDKIKVDARNKDTMRNTIDDGFHAAFASTCDIYISNDIRSIAKAKAVYQKLQLNTRILTPAEFVAFGNSSLVFDDPHAHLHLWLSLLGTPDYNEEQIGDATWHTYILEMYLFDYFNLVSVIYAPDLKQPQIVLRKSKPTNYRFVSEQEVQALIGKLNTAFDAIGEQWINPETPFTEDLIYCWSDNGAIFRLQLMSGYLQLYLDLPEQQE